MTTVKSEDLFFHVLWPNVTYKTSVSFHTGFSVDLIVLVFLLTPDPSSGINFILTYGSEAPFGSIGIKFRACFTKKKIHWKYTLLLFPSSTFLNHLCPSPFFKNHYLFIPSAVSLFPTQVIFSSILPRRSVWSQPHKFGTLSTHLLCTFMSHATPNKQIINVISSTIPPPNKIHHFTTSFQQSYSNKHHKTQKNHTKNINLSTHQSKQTQQQRQQQLTTFSTYFITFSSHHHSPSPEKLH